jgi:serine/threonine protein kinase
MDQHSVEHPIGASAGVNNHSSGGDAPAVAGYSVCRRLGRGGSAEVWLVSQDSTGVKLALKCFGQAPDSNGAGSPESGSATARENPTAREDDIRREVLAMSVLDHEHLVRAYGVVRTAKDGGGAFGLLMDYAAGGSLQQLVTARGRLSVGETVTVLTPIAQVLGYLHGKGFTHSDVAPGNVLFTAHGKPLLADLGVVRMVGDASGVPERHTAGFTDPAPVDAVRAGLQPERDVYAAAALGWYCLTGQPPPPSLARAPLSLLVPEVPAELAAALEAGLSDDRRQRPVAAEFATAVYRSAAAAPLDLSRSVHDTVLPELLTRRPLPQPGSRLRVRLLGWGRRVQTTGWVGALSRLTAPRLTLPAVRRSGVSHAPGLSSGRITSGRHSSGRHSSGKTQLLERIGRASAADVRGRRFAMAAGIVVAALIAGALSLGWPPAGQELGPAAQETDTAAKNLMPGAPQYGAVPQQTGGVPADVRRRLAAKDPVEAVRGLAQLRSLALREGRLELLDQVNAPDTPAHAADRAIRAGLERSGTVLAGFTTSLTGIRRLPESTATRVVVVATSSATGYEERAANGGVVATGEPQRGVSLRLVLVPVEGSWRIADILSAD